MFWANFYAAVGFWSIALAGGLYWSRRYVRAIEARAGADARIAELEARLSVLEGARTEPAQLQSGVAPPDRLGARAGERLAEPR